MMGTGKKFKKCPPGKEWVRGKGGIPNMKDWCECFLLVYYIMGISKKKVYPSVGECF